MLRGKAKQEYTLAALQKTTELLELNPEFNAVWNYRRHIYLHLFECGALEATEVLPKELFMVLEMMKQYPKCYWIWNHRRWCLAELNDRKCANWKFELAIVLQLLEKDSRNFHGWHYRRYVVSNMASLAVLLSDEGNDELKAAAELSIDLSEFAYTTAKINKDISNFSAWHNRSKLIPKILKLLHQLSDPRAFSTDAKTIELFLDPAALLAHELDLVKTGLFMDPDDTSVWLYMQWLLSSEIFYAASSKENRELVLRKQLLEVEELNTLEKEDSTTNQDNVWCVKTIIFIKALLNELNHEPAMNEEVKALLEVLVALDPLRKGRYLDQIAGLALLK